MQDQVVKSKNQEGGITAHTININAKESPKKGGVWENPVFLYVVIPILVGLIIAGISYGIKMFGKDKTPSEVYNVESNNQQGGITAGKIENLTVVNPIVDIPKPKFEVSYISKTAQQSKVLLKIISQTQLQRIKIEITDPDIVSIQARKNVSTSAMFSVQELYSNGYASVSFENASGEYMLFIATKEEISDLLKKIKISTE